MLHTRLSLCLTAAWGKLQGAKQREEKQEEPSPHEPPQPVPEQNEPEPNEEAVRSPCAVSKHLLLSAAAAFRLHGQHTVMHVLFLGAAHLAQSCHCMTPLGVLENKSLGATWQGST